MSPEDLKAWLKNSGDMVEVIGDDVELKRSGSEYRGLCPFHDEKTPSFYVVPEKGFFKCFGCGESGDIIQYAIKRLNVGFMDALRVLGERHGIEMERRGTQLSGEAKKRSEVQKSGRMNAEEAWGLIGVSDGVHRFHLGVRSDKLGQSILQVPFWGPKDPRPAPGGWLEFSRELGSLGWSERSREALHNEVLAPSDFSRRVGDTLPVFFPHPLVAIRAAESGILAISRGSPDAKATPSGLWFGSEYSESLRRLAKDKIRRIGLAVPFRGRDGRTKRPDLARAFHATSSELFRIGIEPVLVDVASPEDPIALPGWTWACELPRGVDVLDLDTAMHSAFELRVASLCVAMSEGHLDSVGAVEKLLPPLRHLYRTDRLLYYSHLHWAASVLPGVRTQQIEACVRGRTR